MVALTTMLLVVATASASTMTDTDFTGDNTSDVLWRNTASGQMLIWFMNDGTVQSMGSPTNILDLSWKIEGVGDFDGSGESDILVRNFSTGQLQLCRMSGSNTWQIESISNSMDFYWKVAGIGDFNGDGNADILWENIANGQLAIWLMNGSVVQVTIGLGTLASSWAIAGTGDFTGDGTSDILWRNTSTGQVLVWTMKLGGVQETNIVGSMNTSWGIEGIGDFTGDGTSDILWENTTNGQVLIWTMSGGTVEGTAAIGTNNSAWEIGGVGDFNGDGMADILWRNPSIGEALVWTMDGASIEETNIIGAMDSSWRIRGYLPESWDPAPMDGNVSVTWFGAGGTGSNDSPGINAAIAYAAANGYNLVIPSGSYGLTNTMAINSPMIVSNQGTLFPLAQTPAGNEPSLISITASNVTLTGGTIDGLSSAYNSWDGIIVAPISGRLTNVIIQNITMDHIGLEANNNPEGISVNMTDGARILGNTIENTGDVTNVAGGGFALYLGYCGNSEVGSNILDNVGTTAINNSVGLNNFIHDNCITNATLFAMKGGYGVGFTVSTNSSPTSTSFSLPNNAIDQSSFKVGLAFFDLKATPSAPRGVISGVLDRGSYLLITSSNQMATVPTPGEALELLDTGSLYQGNTINNTGDNAFDQNGVWGIQIIGNTILNAGMYGTAHYLREGIWIGYDPQNGYNYFMYDDVTILNNTIDNSGGCAISLMATPISVLVSGNTINQADLALNSSENAGIQVNVFTFYVGSDYQILNNSIISSNGIGVLASYATGITISNNVVQAPMGIEVNSAAQASIVNNSIVSPGTNASSFGVNISDLSGNAPSSDIYIGANDVSLEETNYDDGIFVSDPNATAVTIAPDNVITLIPGPANPINLAATGGPTAGLAPLGVQFTVTGTAASGAPVAYAWTFGDGSASTNQNPFHLYEGGGRYVAEVTASDGQGDTNTVEIQITVLQPAGQMTKITFAGYARAEALTNFPVLVVFGTNLSANGFSYRQVASSNGWDLVFMDSDQTQTLNYEIEKWNTNGNSYVWVQVPQLTSNSWIWAHWGDSNLVSAPAPSTTNGSVWANGYVSVWHLGETNDSPHDSTSNRTTATVLTTYGSCTQGAPGEIGNGCAFGGGYISTSAATLPSGSTPRTVSTWFKKDAATTASPGEEIIGYGNNSSDGDRFGLWIGGSGIANALGVENQGVARSFAWTWDPNWHYLSAMLPTGQTNLSGVELYYDGIENMSATGSGAIDTVLDELSFAAIPDDHTSNLSYNFAGVLDEVRISNLPRSSNWVWAEYMNMGSNEVFNTYGAVALYAPAVSAVSLTVSFNGGSIAISWPATAPAGAVLQTSLDLVTWTNSTATVVSSGTNNTVGITLQNTEQFYRLAY
jgi:archaellum component FlaG (FlaF/FlaG flagellin family)